MAQSNTEGGLTKKTGCITVTPHYLRVESTGVPMAIPPSVDTLVPARKPPSRIGCLQYTSERLVFTIHTSIKAESRRRVALVDVRCGTEGSSRTWPSAFVLFIRTTLLTKPSSQQQLHPSHNQINATVLELIPNNEPSRFRESRLVTMSLLKSWWLLSLGTVMRATLLTPPS